jgi:hypothetical protein
MAMYGMPRPPQPVGAHGAIQAAVAYLNATDDDAMTDVLSTVDPVELYLAVAQIAIQAIAELADAQERPYAEVTARLGDEVIAQLPPEPA